MTYSVWDRSSDTYKIYSSALFPIPKFTGLSGLGSTPQDSVGTLPEDSRLVRVSPIPKGIIVDGNQTFNQFWIYLGIGLAVTYIWKLFK